MHGLTGTKQKRQHVQKRSKKVRSMTLEGVTVKIYSSITDAAKDVGGSVSAISEVCSGRRKTHKDLRWKYVL